MHIQIITSSKSEEKPNEDNAGSANGLFWLLDGASMPANAHVYEQMDSRGLVEMLSSEISRYSSFQYRELTLKQILRNALMVAESKYLGAPKSAYMPNATCIICRVSNDLFEYLYVGDSVLMIDTIEGTEIHSDSRLKSVASELRDILRSASKFPDGYMGDSYKEAHAKLVEAEQDLLNKENGYWMAAPQSMVADNVIAGKIPLSNVKSFALMSDGFTRAVDKYKLFGSYEKMLSKIKCVGVGEILKMVRDVENADPAGKKFRRSSISDDATAIFVSGINVR